MTPHLALEKYLSGEIDFFKLFYIASEDPECQLGGELLEHYDMCKNIFAKGRMVPDDIENNFKERMQSLLRRDGWK